MSERFKLFLIVFLLSMPFWWGVNIFEKTLEGFYLAKIIENSPSNFFIAEISQSYQKKEFPSSVLAESALSVELSDSEEKVFFKKNAEKKMPIASLTKLMTAVVAWEFYQPDLQVLISKEAVSQPEKIGFLRVGEILTVDELLHIMLIESSNDAAFALSEVIGTEAFTDLMNLKAKELGMNDTKFFDPTGVDPEPSSERPLNLSTAQDLVTLAKYILKNKYLMEIISTKEYPLYLKNGIFHHNLYNTNKLLGEMPSIIGGKTGFTEKAGECLLLISKGKKPGTYLISVVLNSPARFEDIKKIITAYY